MKRQKGIFLGVWGSLYESKDIHSAGEFEDIIELEFEGKLYLAPRGYEVILTNLYNNYMQLPPEEKRTSHHEVIRYWINEE